MDQISLRRTRLAFGQAIFLKKLELRKAVYTCRFGAEGCCCCRCKVVGLDQKGADLPGRLLSGPARLLLSENSNLAAARLTEEGLAPAVDVLDTVYQYSRTERLFARLRSGRELGASRGRARYRISIQSHRTFSRTPSIQKGTSRRAPTMDVLDIMYQYNHRERFPARVWSGRELGAARRARVRRAPARSV